MQIFCIPILFVGALRIKTNDLMYPLYKNCHGGFGLCFVLMLMINTIFCSVSSLFRCPLRS